MCKVCENNVTIIYEPSTGEYLFPTDGIMTAINYCPFCGRNLKGDRV